MWYIIMLRRIIRHRFKLAACLLPILFITTLYSTYYVSFCDVSNNRNTGNVKNVDTVPAGHFVPLSIPNVWVMSAFHDTRFDFVRVLLLMKDEHPRIQFWARTHEENADSCNLKVLSDHHNTSYLGSELTCRIEFQFQADKSSKFEIKAGNSSWTTVSVHQFAAHIQYNVTACIPPLYGDYYTAENMIEYVEFSKILGSDHFDLPIMYHMDPNPELQTVISLYQQSGLIDVQNWNLPVTEVWYNAQSLAIQDCLYRYMHRSKYVIFLDLDEYFVPVGKDCKNYSQLLKSHTWKDDVSAFCAFPWYFPIANRSKTPIVLNNARVPITVQLEERRKCMVRPEMVIEMGIHGVVESVPGTTVEKLDTVVAIIAHYKTCSLATTKLVKSPRPKKKISHFCDPKAMRFDWDTIIKTYGADLTAAIKQKQLSM